ncbi:MAG: cytochrome c biogenesis protein CcsA [Bacteroidetes bacterium]|nr:cytochrome c biogenesis protein CcsA [Rhodothermia bacterium]MCX7906710.1 cytochrome c biogenesis protein CcsA [Bacteroidota bacterium]MDW8137010.1 cytochrome c biogenesis protein CcsA [Bacteroidota bacterium]MDW8285119.1 cytochrome c biogenesis protein CcsA [Bacteroidota bacterium]
MDIGFWGSALLKLAFVATAVSGWAYYKAVRQPPWEEAWTRWGRASWMLALGGLLGASALLLYLLVAQRFEYAYVYQHTARELPLLYVVSAFWAGQEGSFLLWALYQAVLGWVLARTAGSFRAPVMAVVAVSQLFLLSMMLGVRLGPLEIGSSPFLRLAEKFPDALVFRQNPAFRPEDGNGLNDLLQNPWMAAHPPTLFVGFAAMVVPFAFAVAGMWTRRYTEWIRPALPWMLFATLALGVGIILGGYWAYVTLSFGGYWAWDPVENSSLVPWLIGAAALHAMIAYRGSGTSYKAALLLPVLAFAFVVYSTFLTRSGILGDSSVHSFVDLGLYNQLLLWILSVVGLGLGLFAYRFRELPKSSREPRLLSREFLLFLGAMALSATAMVIIVGTSTPILGRLFRENPAPPDAHFYNNWTLPLAIVIGLLIGLGQLLWWHRTEPRRISRLVFGPFMLAAAAAALALWGAGVQELSYLLLVFASAFAFFANVWVLMRLFRGNPRLAGGAVAHLGVALMLVGIVASSGYDQVLVPPGEGILLGNPEDPHVAHRDARPKHFQLYLGESKQAQGYRIAYTGRRTEPRRGETFYRIEITDPKGRLAVLEPSAYKSRNGQAIQHPDVASFWTHDLYVAVVPDWMLRSEEDDSTRHRFLLRRGEAERIGDYEIRFLRFRVLKAPEPMRAEGELRLPEGLRPEDVDIAVAAAVEVRNRTSGQSRTLEPVYLILKDRTQRFLAAQVADWNVMVRFEGMRVEQGQAELVVEGLAQPPWVLVEVHRKPFIGLLWLGTLVLMLGFSMAILRRWWELRRLEALRRSVQEPVQEPVLA